MSEQAIIRAANAVATNLEWQLASARATIRELEKRAERLAWEGRCEVEELEKRIGELEAARDDWREAAAISERDRAAERQRREDCEAALRQYTGTDLPGSGAASDYLSRYASEAENE